jgi:hypothetical protein
MIPTGKLERLFVVFVLPVFLAASAHAQIKPVRIDVSKVSKKNSKTVYQDSGGTYRNQQVNETIHYTIQVVNSGTLPLTDVKIKWAVLYDSSQATMHGDGVSATASPLKILEGEQTCSLRVGQKYAFDTESLDLSSVNSSRAYTTKQHHYGGEVIGYAVEVLVGDKLAAEEVRPSDIKSRIEKAKASQAENN